MTTNTHKHISTVFSFLLIGAILVAGFVFHLSQTAAPKTNSPFTDGQTSLVRIGGKAVTVRVASTEASREQGLSGTAPLAPDTGMLFVFDYSGKYGFWMKDMKYSLDIIWVDSNDKIVHIEHSLSPDTYPTVFTPETPAQYVIELSPGFAETNAVNLGDTISIGQ